MHRKTVPALLAITALALGGCAIADNAIAGPSPSPGDTEQATPTPLPSTIDESLAVDWPGKFEVSLPNGWSVRDCDGHRLDACVHSGEAMIGGLELLTGYPLDETQLRQDAGIVLSGLADGFLTYFREDRAAGCSGFEFVADEVRDASVGGQPGKRAAFTLIGEDGQVVERVVNHFALQGETYVIVNTNAYVADGGCLGPSEYDPSFEPADLATFEQYLDELVADSPLPAPPAT